MAAHLNITSTEGVTLATGAEADDVEKVSTVEIAELADQATGEYIKASPVNHKEIAVRITGDGPHDLTEPAAGTVADPATITVISAEVTEAPNQRCNFSVRATGHEAFTDPAGSVSATGAEPDIDDLEIVSVEYSIAENVRRSYEVEDMVLVGTDGTPANRATVGVKGTFSIQGRGDLPAGTALGTGGAAFQDGDTGLVLVNSLMEGEKRKDWNRWGADGSHYKVAA